MIMPIDIEKKEFTRDKRGYNSREVDEFLDIISVDYEKILTDNRNMAHKIKVLEKQLEESMKSDSAVLETLETAKRLMQDISASAERRAELMMRDAELEAENMMLEARAKVRKLNEEHLILAGKVQKIRSNLKIMLQNELDELESDSADLLSAISRDDIPQIEKEFARPITEEEIAASHDTLVNIKSDKADADVAADGQSVTPFDPNKATVSDLSDSLKRMAEGTSDINETVIAR